MFDMSGPRRRLVYGISVWLCALSPRVAPFRLLRRSVGASLQDGWTTLLQQPQSNDALLTRDIGWGFLFILPHGLSIPLFVFPLCYFPLHSFALPRKGAAEFHSIAGSSHPVRTSDPLGRSCGMPSTLANDLATCMQGILWHGTRQQPCRMSVRGSRPEKLFLNDLVSANLRSNESTPISELEQRVQGINIVSAIS